MSKDGPGSVKERITEVAENIIGTKVVDRKQQWMTCKILNMISKSKEMRNQGKKDELTVMNREIKKECRKALTALSICILLLRVKVEEMQLIQNNYILN